MSTELVFRKAGEKDIPQMCEFRKTQLIHEGLEPSINIDGELRAFFEGFLKSGALCEFIAYDGEKPVGSGAVIFYNYPPSFSNKSGKVAYITNMFTKPEYRGLGIATKMLALIEEEAKRREVYAMRLGASKLGRPVYTKFGFASEDDWMIKKI